MEFQEGLFQLFQSVKSEDGSIKCTAYLDGAEAASVDIQFAEVLSDMEAAAEKLANALNPAYEKMDETGKALTVKVAVIKEGQEKTYDFKMVDDELISEQEIEL
ncbi:MAG: hypothetical protein II767_07125 [Proteobacteria bacterium]|nr:hypothetical protein [Pseudomonadota bacterium]